MVWICRALMKVGADNPYGLVAVNVTGAVLGRKLLWDQTLDLIKRHKRILEVSSLACDLLPRPSCIHKP